MKKQLSCLLAVSMLASMGTTAFANSSTGKVTAEGDNEVNNAIYNYQIPMTLDFAIDPFEKGGASQVFSGTFPIINKSDVPLSVKVSAKATPKSNVTLKGTSAEVTQTAGNTVKEVYVEAVAAKTVKVTATGGSAVLGMATPTVTVKKPTTDTVTFVAGDDSTEASISMDLAGVKATAAAADDKLGAFTLLVKDAGGNEVLAVDGANVTGAAQELTDAEIAKSFSEKDAIMFVGNKSVALTSPVIASGTSVSFAAAAAGATDITATGLTCEIIPQRGTPKTAAVDLSEGNAPTYPTFNDTAESAEIKDGANTRGKIKIGEAEKEKLWFVLDKATYGKNFTDGENTLLTDIEQKNAAGFRLMGTANSGAPWQAKDVTVTATFDVSGVASSAVKALPTDPTLTKLTLIADTQGVYEQPAEVKAPTTTLDLNDVYTTSPAYTDTLDLDTYLGTKMATVSKVEFKAAGAMKTATFTAWASPANYSYDAATGKIKLTVAAQKLLKDINSSVTAKGGISATYKADTMEAENQLKITFSDGKTTGAATETVTIVIPVTTTTVAP